MLRGLRVVNPGGAFLIKTGHKVPGARNRSFQRHPAYNLEGIYGSKRYQHRRSSTTDSR